VFSLMMPGEALSPLISLSGLPSPELEQDALRDMPHLPPLPALPIAVSGMAAMTVTETLQVPELIRLQQVFEKENQESVQLAQLACQHPARKTLSAGCCWFPLSDHLIRPYSSALEKTHIIHCCQLLIPGAGSTCWFHVLVPSVVFNFTVCHYTEEKQEYAQMRREQAYSCLVCGDNDPDEPSAFLICEKNCARTRHGGHFSCYGLDAIPDGPTYYIQLNAGGNADSAARCV